ncbi:MAG: DUF1194 domain-containing protein [Beijerinckiaceae bacterium]|nr:DUF1194 domain-containing protein [Beijerinckiaceae bacterium]
MACGSCMSTYWRSWFSGLAFVLLGLTMPALARDGEIDVDVELVLAVDVSYSMDPEEQKLQREGYIEALNSPEILKAIAKGVNGKIAVAYVEWAGTNSREIVADWHIIDSAESAAVFTRKLVDKPTRRLSRTSISGVIDFAVPMFASNNMRGLKQVIDISGDGSNNQGRPVERARDDALAQGIVINGLPIMLNRPVVGYRDVEPLDHYYADCVVGGPGSFVIPIREREQFVEAIRTKILLEIASIPDDPLPIQKAQLKTPRVDCMIGEKLWRERWENN